MWTPGILRQCLACTFEPITAGCGPEGQVIENCWIRHEWPSHVDCSNTHPKISPRFLSCSDTPNPDHLFARSSVGTRQRLPAGEEVRQFRSFAICWSNFTAFLEAQKFVAGNPHGTSPVGRVCRSCIRPVCPHSRQLYEMQWRSALGHF